ncbi:MAG: ChaN family lipoprotein [Bacteroidia bacterium]
MKELMGGHGDELMLKQFIAAQAVKDATMAHFIMANRKKNQLFYHINGAYHSDDKEGIAWYLKQAEPEINIVNITVVKQENLDKLEDEYLGKADVIIVVPSTMTVSY